MTQLLKDIQWADPIFASKPNPEWEAHVKNYMGLVPDVLTRVSGSPWLRALLLKALRVAPIAVPRHLVDIATLVCAQENACRYCYGIARTQMRFFGYSDQMVKAVEQDMLMAELDQKDRTFIRFCRNLARSNPRPPKRDRDKLLKLGFSSTQVSEMAFHIAHECFANRVITFISSPPIHNFEQLTNKWWARLLRPLIARKLRAKGYYEDKPYKIDRSSPFVSVFEALSEVPSAVLFQEGIEGAFTSEVLSKELKILMFAVVARSLSCEFCSNATYAMALETGIRDDEFDHILSTLTFDKLSDHEQLLLSWVRDTVHYETAPIQKTIIKLSKQVDEDKLLEAIGVAALANSMVRLGVLLE